MAIMLNRISAAVIFLCILSGGYFHAAAQNHIKPDNSWLESTTFHDSEIILDYLSVLDFNEKIHAIEQLSGRKDRNFSFLIEEIYYSASLKNEEREFLLYKILEKLITDIASASDTGTAFIKLCSDIASYRDSSLRKLILEKTDLLDRNEAENILLKEALFLKNHKVSDNILDAQMLEESRILFIKARKLDSVILNDYIQQIYIKYKNIPESFRKL
jgi:hypothetical protein